MSHVDEGTIHAWLDGAFASDEAGRSRIEQHLAGCEACRDAVETERRLRDRAAEVLGAASPDAVRVAPFERILAERRRRDTLPAGAAPEPGETDMEGDTAAADVVSGGAGGAGPDIGRRRFRMPMALAATLVLALGATWFARQMIPANDGLEPAAAQFSDAVQDEAAEGRGPAAAPEPGTPAVQLREAAGPERRAAAGAAERDANPPEVALPPPAMVASTPAGSTAVAGRATAGQAAAPPPAVSADIRNRSPAETRRLAEAMLDSARLRLGEVRIDQLVVTGVATPSAGEAADADAVTAVIRLNRVAGTVVWTAADPDTVEARLGMTPLGLSGLSADSIQIGTVDGATVVRSVYAVDGRPVELLQWVTGSISAEAEGLRQEEQARTLERRVDEAAAKATSPVAPYAYRLSGLDFLIRGALPPDSLAALSARIGPAR